MASVIIIISDTDEDGGVNVKAEFDPPLSEDENADITAAQAEAGFILEIIQRRGSGQTLAEIADDMDDDAYGTFVLEDQDDEPDMVH